MHTTNVTLTLPNSDIGPTTLLLTVGHAGATIETFLQDAQKVWDRREAEEWESDDELLTRLKGLGYTITEPATVSYTLT